MQHGVLVAEDLVAVGTFEGFEFEVMGIDVLFEVVAVAEDFSADWIGAPTRGFHCLLTIRGDVAER